MSLNKEKIELIKKIVDARLTKTELKQIADKATELIDRRLSKTK